MRADGLLSQYHHPSARPVNTTWGEGVISFVDPETYLYTVALDNGVNFRRVRRLAASAGDASLLPVGARVLVCSAPPLGPYICGIISYPPKSDVTILPHLSSSARRIQAGDGILYGTANNYVAALSTGACVMQSNPMSHVSTHPDGHVDVYSRTFSHLSLFGYSQMTRQGDLVNYSIRGGSTISENTSPLLDDGWTFRADVGAAANTMHVRVTTPGNRVLSELYMGADGSLRIGAKGGRLEQISGSDVRFVEGDESSSIKTNSSLTVEGDRTEKHGSHTLTSKGAASHTFQAGYSKTVIGTSTELISGKRTTRILGDDATATDGSSESVTAPTYAGALPNLLAPQSVTWVNYAGSYNFCVQSPGQAFNVYTTGPASVNLGIPAPAVYNPLTGTHTVPPPVTTYTPVLLEKLKLWMDTLLSALELHEHVLTPAGLVAPSATLPATTTALKSSLPALGSDIVRIGG